MGFTALERAEQVWKWQCDFSFLEDFDSIIWHNSAQISLLLEMEKSNHASVNQSIAMHEWSSVSFPVQWFVVAEMTCPFEKDQNGVWFKKCFPHFAQLWSSKCLSSANNATKLWAVCVTSWASFVLSLFILFFKRGWVGGWLDGRGGG